MGIIKIKGSALQLTILISVVVALLLSSFLVLTHSHQFFNIQSDRFHSVIEGANFGIVYCLNPKNEIQDSIAIQQEEFGEIKIEKNFLGAFTKIESSASHGQKKFSKMALTGAVSLEPRTAIYVSEKQQPLVLVGGSRIVGDVYVSSKGVKPGVISGNYYNGNELVKGSIKASKGFLPKLDNMWLEYSISLIESVPEADTTISPQKDGLMNSFLEPTILIYNENEITLSEKIIGNIEIRSLKEIIVTSGANLKDVLLIAPKITFAEGFSGNVHAISDDKIFVDKNVTLTYPSSLVLIERENFSEIPTSKGEEPIVISDNSKVSGLIMYLADNIEANNSDTSIWIQPWALVKGEVYCSGNLELSGTIHGSAFAHRFVVNEFGSKYMNHIYNGKIISSLLPQEFSGLPLSDSNKSIAQWLY